MMTVLQRFWIQITSDRRRFGILCACVAVALLLWARIIVISKPPRTAIAAPKPAEVVGGEAKATKAGAMADNVQRPTIQIEMSRTPLRDPFRINDQIFPKASQTDHTTRDESKLSVDAVEDPVKAEERRIAQWRAVVESLTLEAVMNTSDQPMALINGRMYRLGNSVMVPVGAESQLTFRLVEVGDRFVILSRDDQRFELKMSLPHDQ